MNRQCTHITLPHQDMYQNLTRECGIFLSQGMKESNCPSLRCHDTVFYLIMFSNIFFVQDMCHIAVIIDIVVAFIH